MADAKAQKQAQLVDLLSQMVSKTFTPEGGSRVQVAGKTGRSGLEVTLTMPRGAGFDQEMAGNLMGLLLDKDL